jgi:RNA polymerase sigma-70 factor (ECF subfamily)
MGTQTTRETASEEALFARIAAGDELALGALYDRHASTLYGLALALTGAASAAEEAVAQAFARFWNETARSASGGTEAATRTSDARGAGILATLTALVRDAALEQCRVRGLSAETRARRALSRLAAESSAGAAGERSASRAGATAVPALAVKRTLWALPDLQRQALELACFAGLSTREIAAQLDEPEARIGQELRAAMDTLRQAQSTGAAQRQADVVTHK